MNAAYAALAKAQANFGPVIKDATNPAFGKKYATLAAFVEAVRPPLSAAGLGLCHRLTEGGCETLLVHESGDVISSGPIPLICDKNNMQAFGSAFSYAKRYGLQMVTALAAEDDDDDGNYAVASTISKPKAKPAAKSAPKPAPAVTVTGKPAPAKLSTKDSIAQCKTPQQLTARLMSWKDQAPVGQHLEHWRKVYQEAVDHCARHTATNTPGWETAALEPVHVVLEQIAGSLEFADAGGKLFGTVASATEGGM